MSSMRVGKVIQSDSAFYSDIKELFSNIVTNVIPNVNDYYIVKSEVFQYEGKNIYILEQFTPESYSEESKMYCLACDFYDNKEFATKVSQIEDMRASMAALKTGISRLRKELYGEQK